MKKNVAILVIGQERGSSLNGGGYYGFEHGFKCFMLGDARLLNDFNVHVFYTPDRSDHEKVSALFGDHLKAFVETDIAPHRVDINKIMEQFTAAVRHRKDNPEKFPLVRQPPIPRAQQVYRFSRLYTAYDEMLSYEQRHSIRHDYIVVLRLDFSFNSFLYDHLMRMEQDNEIQFLSHWDYSYMGRRDLMCHVCNLVKVYGTYNFGEVMYPDFMGDVVREGHGYYSLDSMWGGGWSESPEVQLWEHIMKYCHDNGHTDYRMAVQHMTFSCR